MAVFAREVFSKRIQVWRGSVFARDAYSERMAEKVSICDSIGSGGYFKVRVSIMRAHFYTE